MRGSTLIHTGADPKGGQWEFWCWATIGVGELASGKSPTIVVGETDWQGLSLDMRERLQASSNWLQIGELQARDVEEAGLVLSGDTEARGLAVEFGTPSLTLYGPTEPLGDWWLSGHHSLIWVPGGKLSGISVTEAVAEIGRIRRGIRLGSRIPEPSAVGLVPA